MTDINKRIESEANKREYLTHSGRFDFIEGAKWWNNELIDEAIEEFNSYDTAKKTTKWTTLQVHQILESLKIKP